MKILKENDFWKWAFSDFLSNSLRGVVAEYIVACAMNATNINRIEWDAYDVVTNTGIKIEVKSSAYLQTWKQEKPSAIRFDIGLKKSWNSETNTSIIEAIRSADVYVFCVFLEQNKEIANPLNVCQWEFLVCSSIFLYEKFGKQKSVSLKALQNCGLIPVAYEELPSMIISAVSS